MFWPQFRSLLYFNNYNSARHPSQGLTMRALPLRSRFSPTGIQELESPRKAECRRGSDPTSRTYNEEQKAWSGNMTRPRTHSRMKTGDPADSRWPWKKYTLLWINLMTNKKVSARHCKNYGPQSICSDTSHTTAFKTGFTQHHALAKITFSTLPRLGRG